MDAAVVVNAIDGPASSRDAAALLCSALRPGAPVLLAGSGDRQACFVTLLAVDLMDLGFSVEACHPDQAGLPFCRPADATSFIIMRSPGQPGAPCPPPPAAWLQQQQRHPPPEPPSGPAATSDNGVVYGILPPHLLPRQQQQQQQQPQQPAPGLRPAADTREAAQHAPLLPPPVQLQLQQLLQLLQPPQPPPLDVREPANLMAVFQQARQLSLAYGGSTLRGHLVRLREHEAELLAGAAAQQQHALDGDPKYFNKQGGRLGGRLGGAAAQQQHALDLHGDPKYFNKQGGRLGGRLGAAAQQQQALDLHGDPKYFNKQGGAAAQQQHALDLHGDPKYFNKQGGRLGGRLGGVAAQQQHALDLHGDPKYFNKQGGRLGGRLGAAATHGFANVPIYSCGGKKWHLYLRKTLTSWEATGDPLTRGSTALPKNPSCIQLGKAAAILIYPHFDAKVITLSLAPIDGAPANYAELVGTADRRTAAAAFVFICHA